MPFAPHVRQPCTTTSPHKKDTVIYADDAPVARWICSCVGPWALISFAPGYAVFSAPMSVASSSSF